MKKLIIIGNTTNARLAHFFFTNDSEYEVQAFAVNKKYIIQEKFCGLPVVPLEEVQKTFPPETYHAFVAVGYTGMNKIREQLYKETKEKGYTMPNYISSKCTFLTKDNMGDNNLILEDNTIQPFVKIGSNNVLWSGNHVGHDVVIEDHCFISSHVVISGFVHIKSNCFLGVNASLRDEITIGKYSLVGAGAAVMNSIPDYTVILPPKSMTIDKKSDEINL